MIIEYLGHSSFKLNFKSASVVVDPFDKKDVGLKFSKQTATIVAVTHDHSDHNKVENVNEYKRVISGPGEYDIEGVSVIGIQTYHDDKKGEDRGKNTVYVFEADELRIAHLGDLGHTLSDKHLSAMGDIDILMIPVGGVYTIDDQKAAEVARTIEADVVIPMHYKVSGMADSFSELLTTDGFVNKMAVKVERGKKLNIKKSDLAEEDQKIFLFEK